jgi:HSP20 family protein
MTKIKMKDLVTNNYDSNWGVTFPSRFDELFNSMQTLMDRAWNDWDMTGDAFLALQPGKSSIPKINVLESEEAFEVEIAVSGFDKKDLELEYKEGCLLIKFDSKSKKEDVEVPNKKWLKREISSRSFRRVVKFPTEIDSSGIISTYDEDCALVTCVLPKVLKTEPNSIKIKIN